MSLKFRVPGMVLTLLISTLLVSSSCFSPDQDDNNTNANANDNGDNNGGTGHTIDDLPNLSDDDILGTGEGEDVFLSGLILVGFNQALSTNLLFQLADSTTTAVNGQLLDVIPDIHVITILVQSGTELQAISIAEQLENVDYAEANYAGALAGLTDLIPGANSVEFAQYQLFITNAIKARSLATSGTGSITVAVLDSGCDLNHVEFANAAIFGGANYVEGGDDVSDDVAGGHGTGVVSLLAASVDGGQIAGLLPGFNITVHKVSDQNGFCSLDSAVLGIIGALNGNVDADITTSEIPLADVINISFSFSGDYQSLARVIFEADSRNVVVVAAAGNNGRSTDATNDRYPAGYSTVISVGATDIADMAAPFSNRSPNLELVAPGVDLLVAAPSQFYQYVDGTSYATAQVAAAAAWLLDLEQGISITTVQNRLNQRGDDLPAGHGFGGTFARRLNFLAALQDENEAPEPYFIRDDQLVEATGISNDTLVSGQTGQSGSASTAEVFSGEEIYWYGYFPGEDVTFELIDGEERTTLEPNSVAASSIDLFLEFLRGIELGMPSSWFSIIQQAVFEVPDLGGERRALQIVAITDSVESDPRPLIYNPLQRGYNIIAYKNFDSAVWHFLDEEGDDFDPQAADLRLLGSGAQPEIDWTGGGPANRLQLGSNLDPGYFVTSAEGENEISPPVKLGACVGAETLDQVCGDDIVLPEMEIVRLLIRIVEPVGDKFATLDLIYVP